MEAARNFVCENNLYASTTQHPTLLQGALSRAAPPGMGFPASLWTDDVLEVKRLWGAVERARKGQGPSIVENEPIATGGILKRPATLPVQKEIESFKNKSDPSSGQKLLKKKVSR